MTRRFSRKQITDSLPEWRTKFRELLANKREALDEALHAGETEIQRRPSFYENEALQQVLDISEEEAGKLHRLWSIIRNDAWAQGETFRIAGGEGFWVAHNEDLSEFRKEMVSANIFFLWSIATGIIVDAFPAFVRTHKLGGADPAMIEREMKQLGFDIAGYDALAEILGAPSWKELMEPEGKEE